MIPDPQRYQSKVTYTAAPDDELCPTCGQRLLIVKLEDPHFGTTTMSTCMTCPGPSVDTP